MYFVVLRVIQNNCVAHKKVAFAAQRYNLLHLDLKSPNVLMHKGIAKVCAPSVHIKMLLVHSAHDSIVCSGTLLSGGERGANGVRVASRAPVQVADFGFGTLASDEQHYVSTQGKDLTAEMVSSDGRFGKWGPVSRASKKHDLKK